MDTSNPVLSGLIRKRQEVADRLEIAQQTMRQLVLDIDAIDLTIRMFAPDLKINAVRVKPVPRRHAAVRHESSRMIFALLREAGESMNTRAIVRRIMETRGMNLADKAMEDAMLSRLASTLRKLRNRGKLVSEKEGTRNMRWGLA